MTDNATSSARSTPRWPIIAREGWPIVAIFVLVTFAATWGAVVFFGPWGWIVGGVTGLLTLWCLWFFRDPERSVPAEADAVVCPADGVVCFVGEGHPPSELALGAARALPKVSVFMNVFNVHVNRSPIRGRVERVAHQAGRFFNAAFDKASEQNERCSLVLRAEDGRTLVAVQIAGLVARRIICRARVGERLNAGDRYGLIRFGSRVDLYLPDGSTILARVGDTVVAGETILARWPAAARENADGARTLAGASA